jgi:DNA-binding transcriptional MerR regulator
VTAVTEDDEQARPLMPVGALARATGVTVRALHHYDAIGLLKPEERTQSGRRLYSPANVTRLYRIVALRRLGLGIEEIFELLDGGPSLRDTVRRHLLEVERSLELQRRLRRTLEHMLELLESEREPTLDEFLQAIEVMTMIEKHYTPEQREELERRAGELGEAGMRRAELEWAELIEAVKSEQAAGTDPADARVLALARRWQTLIEQFTGGDEGIASSLQTMYRAEGPQAASRGMVDPELMSYVSRALAAIKPPPAV